MIRAAHRQAVLCTLILLTAVVAPGAMAEDVEKRWRLGFGIGGVDYRDSIRSDSANILTLTDENEIATTFFEDPRNDSADTSRLQIESGNTARFSAQYAFNKIFIVEFSGGYQKADIGNVELQAQFTGDPIPEQDRFKFEVYLLNGGELEQVPLKATAIARFRPRASFNPYIGLGLGYTFVSYTASADMNELSRNMDRSFGQFGRLQTFPGGFRVQGEILDLEGVDVNAPDTFTWNVTGGIEYSFKRKWAAYLDVTYTFASQNFSINFNRPGNSVGIAVPNEVAFETDPVADEPYGTILVTTGGFIDGGRLVPPSTNPAANCETDPVLCSFVFEPDGKADPGFYYVKGGALDYDDITAVIGIRFTF